MNETNEITYFKLGAIVRHRTNPGFTMIVAKYNFAYKNKERIETYVCKFYNKDTNQWDGHPFYHHELILVEDTQP